jgi:hypothetical protein
VKILYTIRDLNLWDESNDTFSGGASPFFTMEQLMLDLAPLSGESRRDCWLLVCQLVVVEVRE